MWLCSAAIAIATGAAVITPLLPNAVRSTATADLVLVLALDVSASVDAREFELQRRGLSNAFRDPRVLEAIAGGATKRIAITAVQWSGKQQQSIVVPWTIVKGRHSAARVSAALMKMPRRYFGGQTDISGMIEFTAAHALSAPIAAPRRVIDISGDGLDNVSYSTHEERDSAVLAGVTINALAIRNEVPDLDVYYRSYVIGGPEAFVITAKDYQAFSDAILRKLIREIKLRFVT
jgi:Protein of unknown function (DUF1194)